MNYLVIDEVWRAVVGYEKLYEVSSRGRIKCLEKTRYMPKGGKRSYQEKIMALTLNKAGYLDVALRKEDGARRLKVHRLVCEAFNGSTTPDKNVCRHRDDIKTNNDPENLIWGTFADNASDRCRNGKTAKGERNGGGGKLTETNVSEIKSRLSDGESGASIARRFGVSRGMIYHINKNRVWKEVA